MQIMRSFIRRSAVILAVSLAVAFVSTGLAQEKAAAGTQAASLGAAGAAVPKDSGLTTLLTVKSDATTLAAATALDVTTLNTGNIIGLTFSPVMVGAFGTNTPVPPGAPAGTVVVNIPPGNGQSGYFKTTFTLPTGLSAVSLVGSANVDDFGRVFLNGHPLSQAMTCSGANCVSEFGNATFSTTTLSYFVQGGTNTLVIADANTGGGPSGTAFYATVSVQAGGDLTETAVSAPPATVNIGGSFAATDTAKNIGTAPVGSSLTGYYLSATTSKTAGSSLLTGSRSVPALGVNATSTGGATVTAPSGVKHGAYYLLACANYTGATAESNTNNNCIASSTTVTVDGPNLEETAVSAPPASVAIGGSFSVTDTVKNVGQVAAAESETRYYLSATAAKTMARYQLNGGRGVPMLAAGATSTGAQTATVPSGVPHGTYYLLACANDTGAAPVTNSTGNCKASASTTVVNGPDLVETAISSPPGSFKTGSSFSVTDTAENIGQTKAGESVTRYYLSATTGKAAAGAYLLTGGRSVPALAVDAISSGSAAVTVPTGVPAGTYYLLACANDTGTAEETNTANNCIASTGQSNNLPLTLPQSGPLGPATVGQSYQAFINASGLGPNYTWKVNGKAIPISGSPVSVSDGITALNTGGNTLSIGGTPASTGTVTLNVSVKDVATGATAGPVAYTITVNPAPGYTVSGSINFNNCNANEPPVTVTIGTSPMQTTTTGSNGQFSFSNIPNGTYTVTPSIKGPSSVFYPASQSVTVNGGSVNTGFNAELGYTVTGTVQYAGARTGRVYLVLNNNNCGGNYTSGTSISAKGAFTVRGVAPGTYTLQAWMDNLGFGAQNASNPSGSTSNVMVPNLAANPAALTVTLKDPAAVTLSSAPGLQGVSPFDQGVFVPFKAIQDNNGVELPASYTIQWSTSSQFTTLAGSHSFPASGANGSGVWVLNGLSPSVSGLAEGGKYYFRAQGVAGSSKSNWSAPIGPVTIGAPTGVNTLSGAVTFTGTATGPLYVGVYDQKTNSIYSAAIAHPVSPQQYSVQVPNGSNYFLFGVIDQNNDGLMDAGDIQNTNGSNGPPPITIPGASGNLTLPSGNSTATLTTLHWKETYPAGEASGYYLNFDVEAQIKLPVAVALISGPNVLAPMDVGECFNCGKDAFGFSIYLHGDRPGVGDSYGLQMTYSDNTTQTLTAKVSAVLDAFATNLEPVTLSSNSLTPTFTWTDPANAASYIYQFAMWDSSYNIVWQIPGQNSKSNGFSSSIAKLVWGVDPTDATNKPSVSSLTAGMGYKWEIQAQDAKGNSTQTTVSYEPDFKPVSLPSSNPSTLGPAIVNQSYNGAITASGGYPGYSWTVTGLSDYLGWGTSGSSNGTLVINGTPTQLGTVSFQVSVRDSTGATAGPVTYSITVGNALPLTLPAANPNSLGPGLAGTSYSGAINASGGQGTYTFTVNTKQVPNNNTPLTLTDGLSATNSGGDTLFIAGTPASAATVTLVVSVKDSAGDKAGPVTYTIPIASGPNGAHNSYLSGRYVCLTQGFDSDGARWASIGSMMADGKGNFSSGAFDWNSRDSSSGGVTGTVTGTYSIGADNNGLGSTTVAPTSGSGNTTSWAIALTDLVQPAQEFRMVEIDDVGASPSGQIGTSNCYLATTSAFAASTISGHGFAFGIYGEGGGGTPKVGAGRFNALNGNISAGYIDTAKGNPATVNSGAFTGAYTAPDATTGRFTFALSVGGSIVMNGAAYIVDANRMFIMNTESGDGVQAGDMRKQQQTTYSAANLNGPLILYEQGFEYDNGSIGGYDSQIFQASGNGAGSLTFNQYYMDDAGTYKFGSNLGKLTITFDSTAPGRVTFSTGGGDTQYLYLFNTDSAFEMDVNSDASPDWGVMEPQTQTTFTDAAVAGNYMMGQMPRMQQTSNGNVGQFDLTSSGGINGAISTAGQGDFTWDQSMSMTYSWDTTATGTGSFLMASGGKSGASCIVVSATKFVCIIDTDSGPSVLIMQQ